MPTSGSALGGTLKGFEGTNNLTGDYSHKRRNLQNLRLINKKKLPDSAGLSEILTVANWMLKSPSKLGDRSVLSVQLKVVPVPKTHVTTR